MNTNQQKTSALEKTMNEYNSWCKQFNISSMWGKWGIRRYNSPEEFDANKFKKIVESKTWKLA